MKMRIALTCFVFASFVSTPSFAQVEKDFSFDITFVGYNAKQRKLVYYTQLEGMSHRHELSPDCAVSFMLYRFKKDKVLGPYPSNALYDAIEPNCPTGDREPDEEAEKKYKNLISPFAKIKAQSAKGWTISVKKVLKKKKDRKRDPDINGKLLVRWKLMLEITGPKGVKKILKMDDLYGKQVSIAKVYPIEQEGHALVVLKTRGVDDSEFGQVFHKHRAVLVALPAKTAKKSASKQPRKPEKKSK